MVSEKRLNRLEGKNSKLTSKEMLSSLSQAKEDHLNPENMGSNPWSSMEYSGRGTDQSYVTDRSSVFDATPLSCCCCGNRQERRSTNCTRRSKSSDSNDMEYACLVDCDELELVNEVGGDDT